MNRPTLDILDAISTEYTQYQGILPLIARQNEYVRTFSLNNQAWDEHYNAINSVDFKWCEIKYEDVVNRRVSIDRVVPNNIGIYLFVVRPMQLINGLPKFVYYVGIAGANNSGRTLKDRLKDYFSESHVKKRDAVRILIYKHYKNLYINYSEIELSAGQTLEKIETALIGFFGTHILANKDDIPMSLKPQSKAFNM